MSALYFSLFKIVLRFRNFWYNFSWCKWISELTTIYFISTFLVLVGIFVFLFGERKLSFYISTTLWLRKYDVFDFSRHLTTEVSRDLLSGAPSSWVSTLPSFGDHGPCECEEKTFLICHLTMWSMRIVSLCIWLPRLKSPINQVWGP